MVAVPIKLPIQMEGMVFPSTVSFEFSKVTLAPDTLDCDENNTTPPSSPAVKSLSLQIVVCDPSENVTGA
jgi:hypothetical protein